MRWMILLIFYVHFRGILELLWRIALQIGRNRTHLSGCDPWLWMAATHIIVSIVRLRFVC